ncbi:MAG: hypothetical protein EA344_03985 [Alkalicoccus sp.]|nr:MAG: hypothetical protein EA344_03985 [Alkalicoccus sp.]
MEIIRHAEWKDTKFTLHLISQIMGKIKLERAHQEPQWAHVTLPLTPSGFTTGLLFEQDHVFQLDVDIANSLILIHVDGKTESVIIKSSKSIRDYFEEIFQKLHMHDVTVSINPKPQEMAYKQLLNEDSTPLSFHKESALKGIRLFKEAVREQSKFIAPLRCRKVKPALFWGTFDVSMIILPGIMEPFTEDKVIEKAAFDEQMIEFGFWLGDEQVDVPSYFVLPYPFINKELDDTSLKPEGAFFDSTLSEYFLNMETIRADRVPEKAVQDFFHSTFDILSRELGWQGCSDYFIPLNMKPQK